MTWKADSFLNQLYNDSLKRIEQERSKVQEAPSERKAFLKETLGRLIGSFQSSGKCEATVIERVVCDGYVRERVELSAVNGMSFAAYVLIPNGYEGKKIPAVIAIHGHGYGSREIVGLNFDGSVDDKSPGIHQHFALQLVRRGMLVIAPDVVGFGERLLEADLTDGRTAPSSCYKMSTQLLMLGKTLTGLRVMEIGSVLDYLGSRSDVDTERLGIMGFSGGGLISYITAALDERIKAVVLTGFTNTFKDSIIGVDHCICNHIPNILLYAELPEWIGLISPRALFLESGERDPIFPKQGFQKSVEDIRKIYEAENAPDQLSSDLFPGVHEISGRYSYDWLADTLHGL
ncbi:alpha/beta hydrolase family protein [Paenibacillus sp. FSL R10-2734]|uniref:dienelactone hydrolase family protein n=1 Tax=Paenibacillus sp. FSL R10-2734 TaxID=2954691 RepID=UPI0030DCA489